MYSALIHWWCSVCACELRLWFVRIKISFPWLQQTSPHFKINIKHNICYPSNLILQFCRHWRYISLTLDITRTPEYEVCSTRRQRLQVNTLPYENQWQIKHAVSLAIFDTLDKLLRSQHWFLRTYHKQPQKLNKIYFTHIWLICWSLYIACKDAAEKMCTLLLGSISQLVFSLYYLTSSEFRTLKDAVHGC